jgi:ketosteroid isomerase-like protein
MDLDNLFKIEKGFWFEGSDFYKQYIADDAVFVFPGMRLGKKEAVNAADQGYGWEELDITDEKLIEISENVILLTYHAEGKRKENKTYAGNITTIYRLEVDQPQMILHQQTPDPAE